MNPSLFFGEIPYCEHKFHPLFQEPLNVLSNVGFLIGAFLLLRERPETKTEKLLILFIALVGLGSSLYHAQRGVITHFLDVIPIYFVLMISLFLLVRKLSKDIKKATISLTLFVALQLSLGLVLPKGFLRWFLNGSLRYVIALFVLGVICLYAKSKQHKYTKLLVYACLSFVAAIFFRITDNLVCPVFPFGTHFLWHIFVSITAYYTTLFLLRS